MSGYIFDFHGTQFTPDGPVSVTSTEAHNREVEASELAAFAQGPDHWHGYVSHPDRDDAWQKTTRPRTSGLADNMYRAYPRIVVKTWLGTVLGTGRLTGLSRGFYGARIAHIRIKAINGSVYIGKYGVDGGSFIRLRKARTV